MVDEFLKTKPRNMVQNLLILHTNLFQIGHYIRVHRPQRSTTMYLDLHAQSLRKLFKDKGIKEKDFRSDVPLIGTVVVVYTSELFGPVSRREDKGAGQSASRAAGTREPLALSSS